MPMNPHWSPTDSRACHNHEYAGSVTRRSVLRAALAAGAASLAGCAAGETPDAVTIPPDATCDVCGMVIAEHPGPSAQAFYAGQEPGGHPNPARFDSTWEAFGFEFEREDWNREAFYVTDHSAVEYEIRTVEGDPVISRHVDAGSFADAAAVTFVADSAVLGTMGADLLGFSERADATSFQDEHGGELVTADEVTPALISQLGM